MWQVDKIGSVYTQCSKHCHQKRTCTSRWLTKTYITAIAMVLNTNTRKGSVDCTVYTSSCHDCVSKSTSYCYKYCFLLMWRKETTPNSQICIVNTTVQVGKHIIKVELNLKKLITNSGSTCKVQKGNHFGKTAFDNSRLRTTINRSKPHYWWKWKATQFKPGNCPTRIIFLKIVTVENPNRLTLKCN